VSTLDTTLSGEIYNIEELFPEWSEEEVWVDVPDTLKSFQLSYPNIVHFTEQKSSAQILGLKFENEVDNKKGSKKAVKEFSLEDAVTSEDGSPLPRVFIGTDSTESSEQFLSHELVCLFQKHWTSEQLERKKALEEAYLATLPTPIPVVVEPPPPSASGSRHPPSSKESSRPASKDSKKQVPTRAISPALRKAEEEQAPSVPPPPVFTELPAGDEIDPLVCHAFRLIARFHSSLFNAPGGGAPAPPFLWRAVFPQLPSGRPCLNKSGKYCVKLFVGGKWRKVTVTDCFPVENGMIAIASSTNPLELWPSILSKALYTVYTASG
jgi:hypothetical protein